ncbi:MAG: histidine kinase [Chitinophagaceae bacterium]
MEKPLHLLLLEDDPQDAELIQLTLRRAGLVFSSVHASDESEFLEALKENTFHAVLADNALPQYSSVEALQLVRATNPHVAFILVTGTVSEEFAVNIIKQGADDYILKTNLVRLPAAVTGAVQKNQVRKEREKEKEFSLSVINSLPGIFFLCDNSGRLLQWNNNAATVLPAVRLQENETLTAFCTAADAASFTDYIHKAIQQGVASTEVGMLNNTGEVIPYYFTGRAIRSEGKDHLINIGVDVSAAKASEQQLQQLNAELHRISLHLETLKEQEQARIAREVHDQLGQVLTGLKMDLAWVKKHVQQNTSPELLTQKINGMNGLMDEAIQTVRRIASDLRPPILDESGLAEALEWKGIEFERRSGIKVHFQGPEKPIVLEDRISTGLYRIYQEILTNIARHAGADTVVCNLAENSQGIALTVMDNGKGFDTTKPIRSLGLLGMKERSYMIGGHLVIKSQPGEGTLVTVQVNLQNHAAG